MRSRKTDTSHQKFWAPAGGKGRAHRPLPRSRRQASHRHRPVAYPSSDIDMSQITEGMVCFFLFVFVFVFVFVNACT